VKTLLNLTLQIGDVVVPVGLASARRKGDEDFRKLHLACSSPITLKPYCNVEEQLLEPADLVSAWEVAPGEYVVLSKEELALLEPPESRTLLVTGFVDEAAVDPVLVERSYWLVPSKSRIALRPYALIAGALVERDAAAVARFVGWGSERVCAIGATTDGALTLRTLAFREDIVPLEEELRDELAGVEVADEELELALDLVERMTRKHGTFAPDDLESRQRPLIRTLLEAKLAGQPLVRPDTPGDPPEPGPVTVDLAGALRTSIRKAPRRRRPAVAR
jgi:DNA end-binding protein Ku